MEEKVVKSGVYAVLHQEKGVSVYVGMSVDVKNSIRVIKSRLKSGKYGEGSDFWEFQEVVNKGSIDDVVFVEVGFVEEGGMLERFREALRDYHDNKFRILNPGFVVVPGKGEIIENEVEREVTVYKDRYPREYWKALDILSRALGEAESDDHRDNIMRDVQVAIDQNF